MYWYVAYGSNLTERGLARYVGSRPDGDPHPSRELRLNRELYFAGDSAQWGGGVAFISLADSPSHRVYARAYRVTAEELNRIFRGENGCDESLPDDLDGLDIPVGGYREVPIAECEDTARGKYNAILRFGSHDGASTYTFTTTKDLPRRPPDPAYRGTIEDALEATLPREVAHDYLAEAVARSRGR